MKNIFRLTHLFVVVGTFLGNGTLSAQDQPAVSAVNGKLDYAGGSMNSAEGHNFSGSISLPLGQRFGFQADALYSRIDDLDFYGSAGQLFWRNPELGLLGIAGGYLQRDGVETFQVGAEGEYYFKRLTVGFFGGVGTISYELPAPFIDTNPTEFVGKISAGYYIVDDLLVQASYTTVFHDNLAKANLEYLTPLNGLALTAEGAWGDNGYDHWLLGIRYYFGAKKSLRDRHRQDDPPGLMQQLLHGLGVYGAEYNRKGTRFLRQQGYTGDTGSYYGSEGSYLGGSYGVIVTTTLFPGTDFPPVP